MIATVFGKRRPGERGALARVKAMGDLIEAKGAVTRSRFGLVAYELPPRMRSTPSGNG